ncbi:hypothetical protein FQA39_LY01598 [Lamprigera yunnana]|nr:hypothetical protein FQA39_LY01598 [Lamprigera yunnana]
MVCIVYRFKSIKEIIHFLDDQDENSALHLLPSCNSNWNSLSVPIDSAKDPEIPQRESLAGSIVNEKTARMRKMNDATRRQIHPHNIRVEIAKKELFLIYKGGISFVTATAKKENLKPSTVAPTSSTKDIESNISQLFPTILQDDYDFLNDVFDNIKKFMMNVYSETNKKLNDVHSSYLTSMSESKKVYEVLLNKSSQDN